MATKAADKMLKRVRSICLALPETKEVEAWGHPTFRAGKKMFAGFGEYEGAISLAWKAGFERQDELLKDPRFYPTPYAARQGWVSLRLDKNTNWDEVTGLLHDAYCQVANKRMIKALESANQDARKKFKS